MKAEDAKRLRELIADVNNASDGDYLDRLTRGYRIAYACAEFIRESGPSLLALYDAVMGIKEVLGETRHTAATAACFALIDSCVNVNAGRAEFKFDGVEGVDDEDLGDWRVTIERLVLDCGSGE